MTHPAGTDSADLEGRVALVTGASRGIGRALVRALATRGAHVIAAARRAAQLEELDDDMRAAGHEITLLQLDLKRTEKVDTVGPTIYQRWGRLDMLASCAGVLGPLSPLNHIQATTWTECFAVNATANWHLIRSCDPILRMSNSGRAVFLTCGAAAAPQAYWGAHAASKAALEALAMTFAAETERTNVGVNLIDPGPTRTDSRARAFPGEDPQSLATPEAIAHEIVPYLTPQCAISGQRIEIQAG
ncbi:MAG: SDR family NAD(P)-dependent oxidoreductase [Pseudomonadota bacterium]